MEKEKNAFLRAIIVIAIIAILAILLDSFPYVKTILLALFLLTVFYYRRAQLAVIPAETKKTLGFDDRLIFFPFYGVFLIVCAFDFFTKPLDIPIALLGGFLFVVGIYIYSKSIKELGKFFSTGIEIKKGHRLITTGPYRFVRHPAYFGGLIFMAGVAIAANSYWGIILYALITVPWYALRIHAEEKMLEEEFGKAFEEYKKKTKIIIPKIF